MVETDIKVTIVGPGATLMSVSLREVMSHQPPPVDVMTDETGMFIGWGTPEGEVRKRQWIEDTLSAATVEIPLAWLADAMPVPRFARMLTLRVERTGAAILRDAPVDVGSRTTEWPGL